MCRRILIISHGAGLCGAERSLLLLLQHMDRSRFEPLVVLARSGPLEQRLHEMGIRTCNIWCPWWVRIKGDRLRFSRRLRREMKATFRLCRLIEKERVDLVYTNTSVILSGALAAFLTGRSHVWHIREILPSNPDLVSVLPPRLLFGLIRAFSKTVVVNSKAAGRQFNRSQAARGFRIVYNAQPVTNTEEASGSLGLNSVEEGDWLVACVGTLQRLKAPDVAIRAIAMSRRAIPRIRLLLIGEGPSEFERWLRALCDELGVSDRITFTGFRTDVSRILSHCQALAMPSCHESFGRVLIEAMAVGIPVIGADAGGITEVIDDGVTGYLVAPQAPDELAERLIHLHQNPDLAKAMGTAGRQAVIARFNVDTYVQSLEQILVEAATCVTPP